MNKKLRSGTLIILGIIIVIGLTSPRVRQWASGLGGSTVTAQKDNRIPVTAIIVRGQEISSKVRATGTVLAEEEVELRSEISGKITEIHFSEGSRVSKGELLLKVDDSELQAQRLKLDSQVKLAQDKEHRRRLLYEKQNISSEDYETTLNELNAVRAELQLVEAKIQKTELRAPFDGLIGLRYVSQGSYVSPETRIASLQNIRRVKIDFAVPERYVNSVRKGQKVYFRLAGTEGTYEGQIFAIEPKIDPGTRTVLLRAVSPNSGGTIVPGGFAEVELILETFRNALLVPTQALVPDDLGQKLYLYRGGVAAESRVETGIRTESSVQITSGLHETDTVLVSGLLQIVPGVPLALKEVR